MEKHNFENGSVNAEEDNVQNSVSDVRISELKRRVDADLEEKLYTPIFNILEEYAQEINTGTDCLAKAAKLSSIANIRSALTSVQRLDVFEVPVAAPAVPSTSSIDQPLIVPDDVQPHLKTLQLRNQIQETLQQGNDTFLVDVIMGDGNWIFRNEADENNYIPEQPLTTDDPVEPTNPVDDKNEASDDDTFVSSSSNVSSVSSTTQSSLQGSSSSSSSSSSQTGIRTPKSLLIPEQELNSPCSAITSICEQDPLLLALHHPLPTAPSSTSSCSSDKPTASRGTPSRSWDKAGDVYSSSSSDATSSSSSSSSSSSEEEDSSESSRSPSPEPIVAKVSPTLATTSKMGTSRQKGRSPSHSSESTFDTKYKRSAYVRKRSKLINQAIAGGAKIIECGLISKEAFEKLVTVPRKTKPKSPRRTQRNTSNQRVQPKGLFQCSECTQTCVTRYNLKRHVKNVHNRQVYKCKLCPGRYLEMRSLREHFAYHLKNPRKYICDFCKAVFVVRQRRNNHAKSCSSNPDNMPK